MHKQNDALLQVRKFMMQKKKKKTLFNNSQKMLLGYRPKLEREWGGGGGWSTLALLEEFKL